MRQDFTFSVKNLGPVKYKAQKEQTKMMKVEEIQEIASQFRGCCTGWTLHKPYIPVLQWLPVYNWKQDLVSDICAGLTVFFTLIPQGLAYSSLAGMHPVYGLYAAGFPVIIYAALGTSKHLVMGPFAITSLLLALVCESFGYETGGETYVKLAFTLTLMSGVVSLFAGLFKMGNIVQYLSSSVMSGFLTGCAVLIIISQVRHVAGISMHGKVFNFTHEKIIYLLSHLGETKPIELAFSIPSFFALYFANRWKRANPMTPEKAKSPFYQALYMAVNMSYFLVFLFTTVAASEIQRSNNPIDIEVVGYVEPGILPTMYDSSVFSSDVIIKLIPQSIMISFVSFSSNWAVVKRYADLYKYTADPSQELFATGVTNIFGSLCFNSFINAGGMARSAVNAEAGGRSQISCALAAVLILITLAYFTPLIYDIPMAVLGSIIIAAVLSMVDTERIFTTYLIDKKESAVILVTFLFTVFIGIAPGIVLGILISMGSALISSAFPIITQYGMVAEESTGRRLYKDLSQFPTAQEIPGIGIIRMHANLYFANAATLKETALKVAKGEFHDRTMGKLHTIIVDMSASIDIDALGYVTLSEIHAELKQKKIDIYFVNFRSMLFDVVCKVDFFKKAGKPTMQYKSIDDAVMGVSFKSQILLMNQIKPLVVPSTGAPLESEALQIDMIPSPLATRHASASAPGSGSGSPGSERSSGTKRITG